MIGWLQTKCQVRPVTATWRKMSGWGGTLCQVNSEVAKNIPREALSTVRHYRPWQEEGRKIKKN